MSRVVANLPAPIAQAASDERIFLYLAVACAAAAGAIILGGLVRMVAGRRRR